MNTVMSPSDSAAIGGSLSDDGTRTPVLVRVHRQMPIRLLQQGAVGRHPEPVSRDGRAGRRGGDECEQEREERGWKHQVSQHGPSAAGCD